MQRNRKYRRGKKIPLALGRLYLLNKVSDSVNNSQWNLSLSHHFDSKYETFWCFKKSPVFGCWNNASKEASLTLNDSGNFNLTMFTGVYFPYDSVGTSVYNNGTWSQLMQHFSTLLGPKLLYTVASFPHSHTLMVEAVMQGTDLPIRRN